MNRGSSIFRVSNIVYDNSVIYGARCFPQLTNEVVKRQDSYGRVIGTAGKTRAASIYMSVDKKKRREAVVIFIRTRAKTSKAFKPNTAIRIHTYKRIRKIYGELYINMKE